MTGIMDKVTKQPESARNPISRYIAMKRWTRTYNHIDDMICKATDAGTVKQYIAYDILVDDCAMLYDWLLNMSIDKNDQIHIGGDVVPRGKILEWLDSDFAKGGRDE